MQLLQKLLRQLDKQMLRCLRSQRLQVEMTFRDAAEIEHVAVIFIKHHVACEQAGSLAFR